MKLKYPTSEQADVVKLVEHFTIFVARTTWQDTEVLECLRDEIEQMEVDARLDIDEDEDANEIQYYHDTIKFVEAQIEEAKKYDQ